MSLFVRDFIDAKPRRVQLVEFGDELAEVLLIDPFSPSSSRSPHRFGVGERHRLTESAHIVLEPLGIGPVFAHKVQFLNAAIAARAPYLPFSEDEEAFLRAEIDGL
jgi:hypothetical protein